MADRPCVTACVTVRVVRVQGSAPRDVGTAMQVFANSQSGTIGGGALEWEAAALARQMLAGEQSQMQRVMPLGPDLGQCCGGTVTLAFARGVSEISRTHPPLWIWGAGHVGRAIAGVMAPFEDREITVVDTSAARMPVLPEGVTPLVANGRGFGGVCKLWGIVLRKLRASRAQLVIQALENTRKRLHLASQLPWWRPKTASKKGAPDE